MRKINLFLMLLLLALFLSSCINFNKQSPLVTQEYLEGMPLILEFSRPVVGVDIYNGEKKIYSYNGDIIYKLKTNLILHGDITVKTTEFYKNRQYINTVKKVEPKLQFLLYGGADNSLDVKYQDPLTNETDYFFDLDIDEIERSIQKSMMNISVVILGDRSAKSDEIIFISKFNGDYIEQRFSPEDFGFSSELSSASTKTLFEFIDKFAVRNSNTVKALDLWDHGNGWAWESKGLSIQPKAIIQDDTTNKVLKIKDIKDVINEYEKKYNTKINILAFDACNMTSLEIIYEFRNLVDYFVGSVYSIAGFGFYYDFFHGLDEKNLEESLVYKIVDKYKYYYTQEYNMLNRLSLVGFNLKSFSGWNNINNIAGVKYGYTLYRNDGNNYVSEPTDMIDVNNLILNTGEFLSSYINPAIVNAVVRIDGVDYPGYSGIGIMFEDIFDTNPNGYYDDYKALDFYKEYQNWIEGTWKNIIKNNN
ncbi:clostripain-related cysteine peptidase [Marinitoga lauensis]|uniref:clostripain-related cysteine peptidase n=1 Tax=Marinitoga lauensis TaxID=2201189 RepID=UPI0010101D93|nr:clostripain-related cysteine peptidase [Marinitoga lauensis]